MKLYWLVLLILTLPFGGFSQIEEFDTIIGTTTYDLQSNGACQNRVYLYNDGTIGAAYTFSKVMYSGYFDRGTGCNYFDGSNWDAWDTARIEDDRTGWPSDAPLGESGEIIFSHFSGQLVYQSNFKGNTGRNEIIISGKNIIPGLYFCTVGSGDYSCTKKMVVR